MIVRMRPCSSASPLHLIFLILLTLAPLPVSPSPLRDVAIRRTMQPVSVQAEARGAQGRPLSPASLFTASLATPELSADQSSNLKKLPAPLRLRDTSPSDTGGGTPITTFDDGLVLRESSGVATNLPSPTSNTMQNSPNAPSQDVQLQAPAASNLSAHETNAAAQQGNGNTITIASSPGPSTAPAASPSAVSTDTVTTSSLKINGTPGKESSTVPHTTAFTLVPVVSVFTTVDSNGNPHTTSVVFSSTSALTNTSVDPSAEQVDHSPGNESPSGPNPPLFSQPATVAGVIIAAVIAFLALCGVIFLIIRHRKQVQKRGELQSIHSDPDSPYPPHQRPASSSSFSASRRHSFLSDRSSTFRWHADARAELEAMSELNRNAVTYSAPPANNGASPMAPTTYHDVQTVTAGKDLTGLTAMQEAGTLSPFADHTTVGYTASTEPLLTLSTSYPQHATSVSHQQHSPLIPIDTGLVPLARAPPLRMRSRSSVTKPSTLSTLSTPSDSLPSPLPLPRVRTASAPGTPRQNPSRWNDLPLLKRTPQLQSAPSLTGSTSRHNPFTDRPSRPSMSEENEKVTQVLQERLSNPFSDADSISEDDVAVANAHASYFPDFHLPGLEGDLGLSLGLGSSRASIEDVLGLNERLRSYTDRMDVRTSVTTITENGRRPVVPRVTVQAPSNEDGISLLSSEADPMEMAQSLDEEHLFYKGGPRGQASLTAVGVRRK